MYYIYTLSINSRVFYVGCSKYPASRYKQHYHDKCSKCYDLIRFWLANKNEAMNMVLIDSCIDKFKALDLERCYIEKYNSIHPILNNQHYPYLYTTAIQRIERLNVINGIKDKIHNVKNQLSEWKTK